MNSKLPQFELSIYIFDFKVRVTEILNYRSTTMHTRKLALRRGQAISLP